MAYKTLKKYLIREGYYPITVSVKVWDDGKSTPFIDFYAGVPPKDDKAKYKHYEFKVHSKHVWEKIRKVIETDLINYIKKGKPLSEKALDKLIDEEFNRIKKDNVLLRKTIQSHAKLLREYRKTKVPDYMADLKEFENLVKTAKKESELQKFLSKKTWLLGLEYENSKPQKIGPRQKYDFYVEKYDGYADIIEIKKANETIFDSNGKLSHAFGKAIQQLITYIDDALYYGDNNRLSKNMEFHFLKPKGILIIGKNEDQEKLKNLKYYFHNIEILTYTEVLERGKTILNHLQSKRRRKKK